MRSFSIVGALSISVALSATACGLQPDDGSKYREPLPAQGSVALAMPGSSAGTSTRTLDLNGSGGGAVSSDAEYYAFSRKITDDIDRATAGILGSIWLVAQTTPTTVGQHTATWGPSQATALEPVVWRLVVTESAADEYDYTLDARPKASTNDADFKTVLRGHGYGDGHALHDTGWFEWDSDVQRALDPASVKTSDRGTAKVTYDIRQVPRTISVAIRHPNDAETIDAKVEHLAQGAGVLTVDAVADVDDAKDGKLESVSVKSRWDATGAGRADATVSGGSLPIPSVSAIECWNASFLRSFYKDSVDSKPPMGSESACPTF